VRVASSGSRVPVEWLNCLPACPPALLPACPSPPPTSSHPPRADNENQRNYQALCRDPATGLEPWVGAIVGPYDQALESAVSWR
jgi:hypothetical protein